MKCNILLRHRRPWKSRKNKDTHKKLKILWKEGSVSFFVFFLPCLYFFSLFLFETAFAILGRPTALAASRFVCVRSPL